MAGVSAASPFELVLSLGSQRDLRTRMGGLARQHVLLTNISTFALFTASTVAVSILMTVLFLHTCGSVLLAIVMHGSILPGKDIASISFPSRPAAPGLD